MSRILRAKIRKFLTEYIIVQTFPFLMILLICLADNEIDKLFYYVERREIFLLSGFAWLALPIFIKEHAILRRRQATKYSRTVIAVGIFIITVILILNLRGNHSGDLYFTENTWRILSILFIITNTLACVAVICYTNYMGLVPARIGLSWNHGGEFTPLYHGVMNGVFERHGIRMDLVPLRDGEDPIHRVITNKVHIEIVNAISLICHRDARDKLTSILEIYKDSPVCFVSKSREVELSDLQNPNFRLGYNCKPYKNIFKLFKSYYNNIDCKLYWTGVPVTQVPLKDLPPILESSSKYEEHDGFDAALTYDHLEPSIYADSNNSDRFNVAASSFGLLTPGEVAVCGHSLLWGSPPLARGCIEGLRESYLNFDAEALEQSLIYCRRLSTNNDADELAARWLAAGISKGDMPVRQTCDRWQNLVNQCKIAGLITPEIAEKLDVHKLYFESFLRPRHSDS